MRCMACGAEMHLVEAVPDKVIGAPGYEQRSFKCSGCLAVERRLAFTPQNAIRSTDPAPRPTGAVSSSIATPSPNKLAALGALARAMAKLRSRQDKSS